VAKAQALNIMARMTRIAQTVLLATLAMLWLVQGVGTASAQGVERIGDFNAWSAYRFMENGNQACYMASEPKESKGNYTQRGDIFALVTHRPSEDRRDEVSFLAGYTFKTESKVKVTIGGAKFVLFTRDDAAWTASREEDSKLVRAMIKGSQMVVEGTSSRGTATSDTYSLSGFTKAYQAITNTCGLN